MSIDIYDGAQETSRAIAALDSTRRHLRNGAWRDVADSYEVFRRSMNIVAGLPLDLTQENITAISLASKYIIRLCDRIEAGLETGNVDIETAKTISVIRQHDEMAGNISLHIQKGAI